MRQRLARLWLPAALVAALALVVVLVRQNRQMAERYTSMQRRLLEPVGGMLVPTFASATLDDAPVTIGESDDGRRQLLLVFTTTCPWCRESIPAWKELASVADTMASPRVSAYGIVLDTGDAAAYSAEHALPYPVVRFPSRKLQSLYRTRSVPLTMVIDSAGRVLYARRGVVRERAVVDSVLAAMRWRRSAPGLAAR